MLTLDTPFNWWINFTNNTPTIDVNDTLSMYIVAWYFLVQTVATVG